MEYKDKHVIDIFIVREGRPTIVILKNRGSLEVWNIAYGYDMGDEFAHITTNISPSVEGATIDLFFTNEIIELIDPDKENVIFKG